MLRCALILTPLTLPFLLFGFTAPEDVSILIILPIVVAWAIAMVGCNHSKRLRDEVGEGRRSVSSTRKASVIFVVVFTLGVALASMLSLPMSRARSHMSGLLPFVFGFWSFVFAGACVLAHELAMSARVNRRKDPLSESSSPPGTP